MNVRGFTLVELLIASTLTLLVVAASLAMAASARQSFAVEPAALDTVRRLREGTEALAGALAGAGGGHTAGDGVSSLASSVPLVRPLTSLTGATWCPLHGDMDAARDRRRPRAAGIPAARTRRIAHARPSVVALRTHGRCLRIRCRRHRGGVRRARALRCAAGRGGLGCPEPCHTRGTALVRLRRGRLGAGSQGGPVRPGASSRRLSNADTHHVGRRARAHGGRRRGARVSRLGQGPSARRARCGSRARSRAIRPSPAGAAPARPG